MAVLCVRFHAFEHISRIRIRVNFYVVFFLLQCGETNTFLEYQREIIAVFNRYK